MIGFEFKITPLNTRRINSAVDRAAFRNISHGLATIRKTAMDSMRVSEAASPPGDPPHSQTRRLPRSIAYDATKTDGVVGPMASRIDGVGAAMEFGGVFRGQMYEPRPFMLPALEQNLGRLHQSWGGSIKG